MVVPQPETERRAETFELFFDLVFVFAITQITHLIESAHAVGDWVLLLSVLLFLWWMYAGFVWLASSSANRNILAGLLLLAMPAFFLLACGIPHLHEGDTLLAGAAALAVVVIHAAGFIILNRDIGFGPVAAISLANSLAAAMILAPGLLPEAFRIVPPLAGIALLCGMAALYGARSFPIVPSHFVERHGLLLIIVFGECIIAVGGPVSAHPNAGALLDAVLVIALVAALWVSWFASDDRLSERALHEAHADRRGRLALVAFWLAFAVMIFGMLVLASGMKLHLEGHGQPDFWIAASLSLYFAGAALFRWQMRIPGVLSRLAGALVCSGVLFTLRALQDASPAPHAIGHGAIETQASASVPLVCALALAFAMLIADRMHKRPARATQG